jgi:hypothetical protein
VSLLKSCQTDKGVVKAPEIAYRLSAPAEKQEEILIRE